MRLQKGIGVGVGLVIFLYFLTVPSFWRFLEPTAMAGIPDKWVYNEDLPIPLNIHTWHSNYQVIQVRLVINPTASDLPGATVPLYPVVLYQGSPPRTWRRLTLNRFTFPRSKRMEVVVPLARLAVEGGVSAGRLEGTLQVEFNYVRTLTRYSGSFGQELGIKRVETIPVLIRLE